MDKDRVRIERILEAIARIAQFVEGYDIEAFAADDKTIDAVLMQFINIGELTNGLSDKIKEDHGYLNWHESVGMRNQIAHGYYDIQPDVVWGTIKEDLPQLKTDLEAIVNS